MRRLALLVGSFVMAAAAVSACSSERPEALGPSGARPPMRSSTTIAEAGTFPVTVAGVDGSVTVVRRPERIVSLSPSATEALYAIEAGNQVVGVDQRSDRPGGTPVVPGLRGARPAADVVERLRPDLVVIEDDEAPATLAGLALQGVPVLEVAVPDTLDDSYAVIAALGQATGHPRRAGEVVDGMRRDIAALAAQAATRPGRGAVYHELDDRLFTVTSLSFVGRLYRQLGFANVGDQVESGEGYRYGQLSDRQLAAADPAWMVLAHDADEAPAAGCDPAAALAARGWGGMAAVRAGHVGVVDGDLARSWGPRVVELVRRILTVTGLLDRPPGRPNQDARASLGPTCPRAPAPPLPLPARPTDTTERRSHPSAAGPGAATDSALRPSAGGAGRSHGTEAPANPTVPAPCSAGAPSSCPSATGGTATTEPPPLPATGQGAATWAGSRLSAGAGGRQANPEVPVPCSAGAPSSCPTSSPRPSGPAAGDRAVPASGPSTSAATTRPASSGGRQRALHGPAPTVSTPATTVPRTTTSTTPTTSTAPATTVVPAVTLTPPPAAMTIRPLAAQPGVAPVVTRVETDDPVVFLTIDDGTVRFPAAQAAFQQLGIPATWFLIDEPITAEPEFFRPLLGTSVVESHTRTHPDLRGLTEAQQRSEICGNADSAARAFGRRPVLFRPPYGLYDEDTQRAAAACGMQAVVLWEQNVNHDMVGFRNRPEFRAGDVILMHLRPQFVQELDVIRQRVEAAGLRFALLEDYLVR